jgi:endothelin-converting enzyme/putative endopeptidase
MRTNPRAFFGTLFCTLSAIASVAFAAGIDRAAIDAATPPGEDFWTYANGTWVNAHPIPADRSSYGRAAMLTEEANRRTVDLIQNAAKDAKAGADAQKVANYYASYMDEAAIEAKGTTPLKPVLARIAEIKDRTNLARVLGEDLRADVDALNATDLYTGNIFGLWASPPLDDPAKYTPFLLQGGLGMPDREYYLTDSPAMKQARAQYLTHIGAVLQLAGIDDADAKAQRIMALETRIATTHASRSDSDDVQKGNNPWARTDFAARAPGLDWNVYFSAAGIDQQPRFIVWQPSAVVGISRLAAAESLEDWKDYLAFRAIEHYAPVLPKAFVAENFAFHGTALLGTPQIRDRWKRAVDATNEALGDAVGRLYVANYFPPDAKAELQTMVAAEIAAFTKRIDDLDWMAASTKAEAKRKLNVLKVGIGYPDKWRDYSDLEIVRGDAFGNLRRSEQFEYRQSRARLGRPVDRSEWVMTPQTVNAVNLPMLNALNFPAAILQAPFFDPKAPAAFNYGGIGATIGHEISHSFDDIGAQFDSQGRLRNWWTPADFKKFKEAGEALALQFDGYKPFPDLAVNGRQTLGENIADLAGLAAAYDAYRASLAGKEAPVVDGLTGDQQFFLAYAQSWCSYYRPEALRQRLINDGHAPARYRASTVRNLSPWYAAFPVKETDTLYLAPQERVRVW